MRRRSWAPLLCLAVATASLPAFAQQAGGGATQSQATNPREAQEHYKRARELYEGGNYRDASTELEIARKLDPNARELLLNLGIVHEKLGEYDEALGHLKAFLAMSGVTASERSRVEGMIKRIEGAKRDAPPKPTATPTSTAPSPTTRPTAGNDGPPPNGRVDELTITAGVVAGVGLVTGTALGIYALTSRPEEGFVTGRDGSYAELQDKADTAHTMAIAADVALGVGIVAAIATAWLYFGRPKDAPSSGAKSAPRVSAGPVRSGAALFLGGSF